MKIALYSHPGANHTDPDLRLLMDAVLKSGLGYKVNREFAGYLRLATGSELSAGQIYDAGECSRDCADMAVSYGGDGTFLECVKLFGLHGIPILGVNSGRLGFLANVPKENVEQVFLDIRDKKYSLRERVLLKAEGDFAVDPEYPYAFNEFSIQRSGTGMIAVETYVDDEMVATYWGDGVLLSTPAGSTAYSLSVGGPVVAPECGCFVISPIAPHNLTMRPVVIPDTSNVRFRVHSRDQQIFASLDGVSCPAGDGVLFKVRKAKKHVFLVRLQNISFYDTLRNKMMWGFDRRDNPVK